jgi:hypothetical protein
MRQIKALLVAASVAAAFLVTTGTAAASRTFDSNITGFNTPLSVAFDGSGNAWISDNSDVGAYKYDPFPSLNLLTTAEKGVFGGQANPQLAIDQSTEEMYMAVSNGRAIGVYDENGKHLRTWTAINGQTGGTFGGIHVAIDNTGTYSSGRIYLSLTRPENDVEAVDAERRPVQFPATASYIEGSKLTGTPDGPFEEVEHITVDTAGNIYVTDTEAKTVSEFASTGEFLRSFPAPTAEFENPDKGGVGVDPTNGDVLITEGAFNGNPAIVGVSEYDASGNFLGRITEGASGETLFSAGTPAVDASGRLYVPASGANVSIFDPAPARPLIDYSPVTAPTVSGGTLNASIDPNASGAVTACRFEYETQTAHEAGIPWETATEEACTPDPAASPPGSNFSSPTPVTADLSSLTTETTYYYRVVLESPSGTTYGAEQTFTPHGVVGLRTDGPGSVTGSGAQLNGSLIGDGTPTSYLFEWGRTDAYGNTSSSTAIGSPSGPSRTTLSPLDLTELDPFTTYHYRVVATGGSGTSYGEDRSFTTLPGAPTIGAQSVSDVHSDRAAMHAELNPNGAKTTYRFEVVDDAAFQESEFDQAITVPNAEPAAGMGKVFESVTASVDGLASGTLYHYRAVATNQFGVGVPSASRTFRTYPPTPADDCPNGHVRQQTGAAFLQDCRAYELASAQNAGGYSVESDLVAGQEPFAGYPAKGPSQVLYGVHGGGIPGSGKPTNHGVDPYVATRSNEGWTTRYVGVPADNPFAESPFASSLAATDRSLDTFAFGGPDICSPCFEDDSTGAPIRLPNGALVQGMAGSLDPGPTAELEGYIGKSLSADGSHFVFGSTSQFEPDGNQNGDLSIYVRDLKAKTTNVVSKTPSGQTMTGSGIGELDVSSDGSRVVFGKLVSIDSEGNRYWHLYVNVDGADESIDLMPTAAAGAIYAGMTDDGSKVYFSTKDQLTGDDSDSSADLYRADVTAASASLTRISAGPSGEGDSDACDPFANTRHTRWNSIGNDPTCDVLAVGGGGGVAADNGTIYFLSPENLDSSNPESQPVENAPNLYAATPGDDPRFVATLESTANAPLPSPQHPYVRSFGEFTNDTAAAIDDSNGDVYVVDPGNEFFGAPSTVYKYSSSGKPVTGFGTEGKITSGVAVGPANLPSGIAVNANVGSPNYRALYVPSTFGGSVNVYKPDGSLLFEFESAFPSSVAVNPTNGNIYVARLDPFESGLDEIAVYDPSGTFINSFPALPQPTSVAVDSTGKVYVANGGGLTQAPGTVHAYSSTGTDLGELDGGPAYGVSVDPVDDHVYVDRGDVVVEYDENGEPFGTPIGPDPERVSSSIGVAANHGAVVVTSRGTTDVAYFGPHVFPADPKIDNPLVVDSLEESDIRNSGDFQVNPSGHHAVFTSTLEFNDYETHGRREVLRDDAEADRLDCVSCNPTEEPATGDATLASKGLSLTDDGRVFFNSTQGLVDRDLNGVKDAYEWKEGDVGLISAGTGALSSSLLGVSGDGVDAYFFTRDTLVNGDDNGSRVKLYDARSFGGFAFVPSPVPCKASDECHGPGSQAAPPPAVGTIAGTPIGNVAKPKHRCKRHKKCRRRRAHGKHHKAGHRSKKHPHRGDRRG